MQTRCGTPSESSIRECRSFGIPSESSICECCSYGIPSESCTSTPFGLICIKDVGIQGRVNPMTGMQILPTGLLSCEESMVFIIDLGASRTSTFDQRDFVPGTLKLYAKPLVLTGVSRTLEIKGEGAVQFQVIMDDGNVKEITTQAYWIPEMKCTLFSLSHSLKIMGETTLKITSLWWEEGHIASSLEKVWITNSLCTWLPAPSCINSRPIIVSFLWKCSSIAGMGGR